jgi:thiol-disulfide isomerase/thioredoxin
MRVFSPIILIFLLVSCYGKKPAKIKSGNEGKLMPVIDLVLIDSNAHFNTKSIEKGKPTVLFSFEPWCPHCKAQTKSILSNIQSLKGINLYFLTNSTYSDFKKFYDRFELQKYPSIKAGIDYNYTFARYFKTGLVPYFAIYDGNRRLKQVLAGRTYVSTIKDIALNEN